MNAKAARFGPPGYWRDRYLGARRRIKPTIPTSVESLEHARKIYAIFLEDQQKILTAQLDAIRQIGRPRLEPAIQIRDK